jgi:hypothetical protein
MSKRARGFWFSVGLREAGVSESDFYSLADRVPSLLSEVEQIKRSATGHEAALSLMRAIQWAQAQLEPQGSRPSLPMTQAPTGAPKRRWSFSLRTLFVVVTLAAALMGWFVWEVQTVRERRRIWLDINGRGGYTITNGMTEEIPMLRFVDGKRARNTLIVVPEERFSENETDHVRAVFSEPAVTVIRCPLDEVRSWRDRPFP